MENYHLVNILIVARVTVTVRADEVQGTVYIIDERCRVRIYIGGEVVYIHIAQGSGLYSYHSNTE